MKVLVTGGLGFIGSAVVRRLITQTAHDVLVVDAETYAATRGSVAPVADSSRLAIAVIDITDASRLRDAAVEFGTDAIIHLAAESHVDRSIDGPDAFIRTNVVGTYNLLEAARAMPEPPRFVHVSTDEVFGSLRPDGPPFDSRTPYDPRSPYSASKAAADHLVRAWHHTFGVPALVTNCSNNYGPFQFPEKLVPLMIIKALSGEPLPVYGRGENIRDWLHVDDHARGIVQALELGEPGRTYLFGGSAERTNLDVVLSICDALDSEVAPLETGPRRDLVSFVDDRPGHDFRYAVDASETSESLGWAPSRTLEDGLAETVRWYLDNRDWWEPLVARHDTGARLGRGAAGQQVNAGGQT